MQNQKNKANNFFSRIILASFLLISFSANSQIIVTDLNPDTIVNDNEIYFLDLDNDGNDDFKFVHEDSASGLNGNGIGVKLLHDDAEFMGDLPPADPTHWYPYKLKINTPIDSNASTMEWVTKHPDPDIIRVLNLQFYNNTYAGQWISGVTNHYLGIRIKKNHEWHYGWILMDVVANATQMTIKSYAYRANPDSTVLAGEGLIFAADSVSNIIGSDIANNANASDINVSFQKASNENTINEYRVILVPNSSVSSFDLLTAQNLSGNTMTKITPNGTNPNFVLSSGILDSKGNAISENKDYVVFVLCMADSNNSNTNFISGPSPIFTLTNTIGIENINLSEKLIVYQSDNSIIIKQIKPKNLTIRLYNTSGSLLYKKQSSEEEISVSTIGFSKGIYFLQLSNGKEIFARKLVLGK